MAMTENPVTLTQITERIHEIFIELQDIIGPATDGAEVMRRTIPLFAELNGLQEQRQSIILASVDESKRVSAENVEMLQDLEERMMQFESIDLTELAATQFIHERGLSGEFKAYMSEQLERVSFNLGERPAATQ